VTCVENVPNQCLVGQETLLQSLEQQKAILDSMCAAYNSSEGGESNTTNPNGGKRVYVICDDIACSTCSYIKSSSCYHI